MTNVQAVIDRANSDPTFRGRLQADPAAAFQEAGFTLPQGASVEVIDTHRGDIHLLLGSRMNVPELDRITERAESDAAFRDRLLREPRAAVEDHTGGKLPSRCKVHVREATPNTLYLYLAGSQEGPEELADDALEAVSGGLLQFMLGALTMGVFALGVVTYKTENNEWQEYLASL
jgi:hypothetical protein